MEHGSTPNMINDTQGSASTSMGLDEKRSNRWNAESWKVRMNHVDLCFTKVMVSTINSTSNFVQCVQ